MFQRGSTRIEMMLIDAVVSQPAGADETARNAARSLRQVAESPVPPEFRERLLQRNPINRELLALASRLLGR